MKKYLLAALESLKELEDGTKNVSPGTAMVIAGMFINRDLEGVISNVETALQESEQTKTPLAATKDVK